MNFFSPVYLFRSAWRSAVCLSFAFQGNSIACEHFERCEQQERRERAAAGVLVSARASLEPRGKRTQRKETQRAADVGSQRIVHQCQKRLKMRHRSRSSRRKVTRKLHRDWCDDLLFSIRESRMCVALSSRIRDGSRALDASAHASSIASDGGR